MVKCASVLSLKKHKTQCKQNADWALIYEYSYSFPLQFKFSTKTNHLEVSEICENLKCFFTQTIAIFIMKKKISPKYFARAEVFFLLNKRKLQKALHLKRCCAWSNKCSHQTEMLIATIIQKCAVLGWLFVRLHNFDDVDDSSFYCTI